MVNMVRHATFVTCTLVFVSCQLFVYNRILGVWRTKRHTQSHTKDRSSCRVPIGRWGSCWVSFDCGLFGGFVGSSICSLWLRSPCSILDPSNRSRCSFFVMNHLLYWSSIMRAISDATNRFLVSKYRSISSVMSIGESKRGGGNSTVVSDTSSLPPN